LAELLAHRAVYSLSIEGSNAFADGDGLMQFDIKDVCGGWAMDLKAELVLSGEDGEAHRLSWNQVSWEAKDGSRYRYFTQDLTDREETSRRRGEARRDAAGGEIHVVADLPAPVEFGLPAGALFPVQHTEAIIAAGTAGTGYLLGQLFDGSIGDQAVEAGAAIGPGDSQWQPDRESFTALKGVRSFPVSLAFFMGESPEGLPDTEQNMRLFTNGVVGSLTFTLGDLTVRASLDDLTALPAVPC
jgi:hypothetical protein